MWFILVLIIIVFVIIAKKLTDKIKIANAEEQKRIENKKATEQARQIYWNSLKDIYTGISIYKLQRLIELLEAAKFYSERLDKYPAEAKEMTTLWADTVREIESILVNCRWKYGSTDAYTSSRPIYYDLDIKYIKSLINK